jgi:hypothetical protein
VIRCIAMNGMAEWSYTVLATVAWQSGDHLIRARIPYQLSTERGIRSRGCLTYYRMTLIT